MLMVSSTVGSPTTTVWKRRSSAASFSMYLRYSLSVVAPDGVQFAARQHRLQHVRRVHRSFGGAGADDGVQLVDEQDDLSLGVGDFLEHRLQPFLEFAAVLRAGDERAHVERDDALVLESFGHVAADDAAGQSFDDGGLADAGLADEHRIVLGAARQHLNDAADFLVAADHRIELALARELGQVATVALERLIGALGVLARDALRAAHARQRGEDLVAGQPALGQQTRGGGAAGLGRDADQQVFGADEVVLQPRGFGFRQIGDDLQPRRETRLRAAVRLRDLGQQLARRARDLGRIDRHLAEHFRHDAFVLLDERDEQVLRLDQRVVRLSASCCAPSTASWAFSVYLLMFIGFAITKAQRSRFHTSGFRQCLEMLPLFGGQLAWQLHVDRRVEVPRLIRVIDGRHPVTLQPKHLTVLRVGGIFSRSDLPASVSTSASPPSTAVVNGTGTCA